MITLEMIKWRETPSGSLDSFSDWVDEVKEIPSQDEIMEILEAEIAKSKDPRLAQVCLNIWKGGKDDWQGELVNSFALDVKEEAKRP